MKTRCGPHAARLVVLAAGLSVALACSDDDEPCSAGTTRDCTCADGRPGTQTCAIGGAGWQACECSGADADADADSETGHDADAVLEADPGELAETDAEETTDGSTYPCLDPGPDTTDASVSVGDRTPLLSGGPLADGRYELTAVVLYPWTAVTDRVTRFVAESNGGTRGAVVFQDGAWGMTARLDLYLSLSLESAGGAELDLAPTFASAGPYTAVDGALALEPGACVPAAPAGCPVGGSLRYEATSDVVAVELFWTRECITSQLPVSYRPYAGMWLAGDLPVVLRFTRAAPR